MASDSDNPSSISPCTTNIPDDIIEEILKRVPVKTLIQFKRVCKLWNSLISSPIFASLQLNSTVGKPPRAVIQAERVTVSSQPPRHINFIDIIHGVVCAAYSATLWNPLICKYVDVPWPPQIISSADQPQQDFISGFGFDHSRNDFKGIRSNESAPKALRTYEGLFAVLKFTSWRYCEMWEMKRYGVDSSWSKLRCFGERIGCERLSFAFQGTMLLTDVEDAREAKPGRCFFWESGWKIDKVDAWWVGIWELWMECKIDMIKIKEFMPD